MPDSFSSRLRLRLQATGGNNNVWGAYLNTAVAQLLEDSIAGMAEITVAASDITLSTSNGGADQARMAILKFGGTPGAARNIFVPQVTKFYFVINNTDSTLTVKTTASGTPTTVAVTVGTCVIVICDGTNVIEISSTASNTAALGGVSANQWARLNLAQTFSKGQRNLGVALTMGAAVAVDMAEGNVFTGVLTENTTISAPTNVDATGAQTFQMVLSQAPSGGPFTVAFNAYFDFLEGAPSMPTGADEILYVHGLIIPGLAKAICFAYTDVSTTPAALTLSVNESNVDIFRRFGAPAGVVNVTVTVGRGVVIKSDSTSVPAMDLNGFAAGSTINLINNGFIIGKGGRGGNAASSMDIASADPHAIAYSKAGRPGGNAIRCPFGGSTINITNLNGRIWGGGGGGGAGGASVSSDEEGGVSGAGGGGAGLGEGGMGLYVINSNHSPSQNSDAASGTLGLDDTDAGGAAGGANTGGGGNAGNGGDGGDYGANGSNGTAASAGDSTVIVGAGGAAGKAIDLNSGATINFVSGGSSPNVKGGIS